MPRKMNLAAVKAAIASPKTPAGLKQGLIKKFGHLLGKVSMSTLATTVRANPKKSYIWMPKTVEGIDSEIGRIQAELFNTRQTSSSRKQLEKVLQEFNIAKRKLISHSLKRSGYGSEYNNPGGFKYRSDYELDQRKLIDIYVTKMKDGYYIDYPHKHYTGKVKTKKQLDAFLKPAKAMGLKISYA